MVFSPFFSSLQALVFTTFLPLVIIGIREESRCRSRLVTRLTVFTNTTIVLFVQHIVNDIVKTTATSDALDVDTTQVFLCCWSAWTLRRSTNTYWRAFQGVGYAETGRQTARLCAERAGGSLLWLQTLTASISIANLT